MASERSQTRRGRPPRISKEQIVEAALHLGLDSFSIQAIADHLGVTAPALYTHVRGRDEIIELVAADLMDRLEVSDESTDWRHWLFEFGRQARRHFSHSATALRVDLSGPLALSELAVGERGISLLIAAGFSPADAGRALWLVFRSATSAGGSGNPSLKKPMYATRRVAAAGTHPAIDRALEELGGAETFDFDLRVIVAGLESELAARRD